MIHQRQRSNLQLTKLTSLTMFKKDLFVIKIITVNDKRPLDLLNQKK